MESKQHKIAKKAPEALKILWEDGFFKIWRKGSQIEEFLAKKGYHFSNATLGMALKQAKHLTRRGKRHNYEYIQKYPYFEEKDHGKNKKVK
jgi:hypothetical protein